MPVVVPRALVGSLALALFALYLLSASLTFPVGGDESILFGTADSLVKRGTFEVDQLASIPKGDPDARNPDWDYGFYGRDGHQYGKSGLGHVLLVAPLEALARLLPGVGLVNVVMLLSPAVTAATGALLAVLAAQLGFSARAGLALGLVYGVATFAWPYAKTLFPEPPSALALLTCFWFLARFDRRPRRREVLGAGLALGLAFWIKGTNLVVAPAAAGFVVWRLARARAPLRTWIGVVCAAGLPLLAAGLAWCAFNVARFGDPLQAGYDFGFTTPLWVGLRGLLLSPGKGYFWYSPVLLAALLAPPGFVRRTGAPGALAVAFVLLQLPVYATWRVWTGGWAWGPRFLLPATPFVALLLLPVLEAWLRPGGGWRGRALAALLGLSVALQLEGLAVHYSLYLHSMVPVDRVANAIVVDQPWASPLLGQTSYLRPRYLDLAWLARDDEGEAVVRWDVLAPLALGFVASCAALVITLRRPPPAPAAILLSAAVLVVLLGLFAALRALDAAEDPRYRRLVAALETVPGTSGYVFSNYADEASFLNLNRSALPGLGLPDATRLTKRSGQLLESFVRRTTVAGGTWHVVVQVAQARPGDPDTAVEHWLAARGFPFEPVWYGPMRLNRTLLLGDAQPLGERTLAARFGASLRLTQVRWWGPLTLGDQRRLPVALAWERIGPLDRSYLVVLQLQDVRGALVAQSDGVPVGGAYPTTAWRKDEHVEDRRLLTLPAGSAAAEWLLVVSLLDPERGEALALRDADVAGPPGAALLARLHLQ